VTTEDDFQAALDARPSDWQTRLVFADWLQERDDPRAEGYRALGHLRAYPVLIQMESSADEPGAWYFIFGNLGNALARPRWTLCLVPEPWFQKLTKKHERNQNDYWRYYDDRRAADDDAARAYAKLSAKRRAEVRELPPVEVTPKMRRGRARKPKPKAT
jgi:uncharacterized protein (TIGR02996 family)